MMGISRQQDRGMDERGYAITRDSETAEGLSGARFGKDTEISPSLEYSELG